MTKNEINAKKHVERLLTKWKPILGLEGWTIGLAYTNQSHPQDYHDGKTTTFDVVSDWKYMNAMITCYVPALLDTDKLYLEHIVIHELMHLVLGELRDTRSYSEDVYMDHEEHAASTLAVAFERAQGLARSKRV